MKLKANCVGCNLCSLVCPVKDCITMVKTADGTEHITWNEQTLNDDVPTTFDDDRAGVKGHFVPKPSDALKVNR